MKIEQIISADEIQTPRKPSDFLEWVEIFFEKINNADPDDNDEELALQIHMRTGIAKQIYEEIIPLEFLLKEKKKAWSGVLLKNVLGNQQYDVEVFKEGQNLPNIPDYLEITYAIEGRDYKLRMEYLYEHGETSMTGPVIEKMNAGKKEIHIESEAKLAGETTNMVCALIKSVIAKKLKKGYPAGTGLIIFVEDYGTFRRAKYLNQLCDVVDGLKEELKSVFQAIYLILSSNEKVVEW